MVILISYLGHQKITGLIGNEERHFFDSLAGDDPCPWIVNLPPIRGEIDDDDGYNGSDEELFIYITSLI